MLKHVWFLDDNKKWLNPLIAGFSLFLELLEVGMLRMGIFVDRDPELCG